jgi:hypothetical protein
MRRVTTFLMSGALLSFAACTRTVIVRPSPEPDRDGSRPPPVTYDPTRPGPSTAATLGIPPGHLPRPGECRIWIPGTPPGQQPRPRSRACPGIARYAPGGSWIVYRPTRDRRYVHLRVVDERRPGYVVFVRIFEIESGRFVQDTRPEDEPQDDEPTRYPPAPPPPDVRPPPRDERPGPNTPPTLGIPLGQLPEPGECRIWIHGAPSALQHRYRPSRDCDEITRGAPAGSWVIYRPTRDRRIVHVRVVDERRRGVVAIVRIFEIEGGRFVRETRPEDEPQDERPLIQRPDRDEPPPLEKPREERPQEQPPAPPPPEEKPREERPQDPPLPPPPPPPPPPAEDKPREDRPGPSTAATLSIPPGHLPEPGECRVWIPGAPPGQQRHRASRDCPGITRTAPAGSWIVYRPTQDRKLVHVRVVDDRRPGVVIRIQIFDIDTRLLVREEKP